MIKPTINKMENQAGYATLTGAVPSGLVAGTNTLPLTTNIPTPQENKIRQINIEEVNRGYIVRVGCHTFAISTKEELTDKLLKYINKPSDTEQKWFGGDLF